VPNSDQDYRATKSSDYLNIPMVTLTESQQRRARRRIVVWRAQDHDRSLIVGETTFGKALVQSVYRVSEGAGVAGDDAHYYTPSGRLIPASVGRQLRRVPRRTRCRDQDPEQASQPRRI
jgi:carboxyl-terminal processing protease